MGHSAMNHDWEKRKSWTRRFLMAVGLVLSLGICSVIVMLAYNAIQASITQSGWQKVEADLPIGMPRAQVLSVMEDIAWGHYECPRNTLSGNVNLEDVYLLGSKDIDQIGVLIIHYSGSPYEPSVVSMGSVEGYRLETVLWGCSPLVRLDHR